MDVTELTAAYRQLLVAAEAISADTPLDAETRDDVDWRLCHIALADRIIANAAREQLSGHTAVVDNQPSMDPDRIASMISTSTHPQRIDNVRRNWAELRTLIETYSSLDAQAQLKLRMHDRNGEYVSDSVMSWATLIEMRTRQHIPGHQAALANALPTL
ncbi:hypothetical protein [Streptomyces sp. WM6378]|uniref:hypothetical protein n=1 Tax=Streptomyces sp. WM6378 TaxID=1415557 RepID=UPI0006AF7725|nr:hypothetical protein [Streptomyces sp. WM6378]KOU38733.1 hypothetical protein ADK54_27695 [Streptomyces sp. WM6378]